MTPLELAEAVLEYFDTHLVPAPFSDAEGPENPQIPADAIRHVLAVKAMLADLVTELA